MSSVYATSKCMLDYYRKGNMARDEPQLVRAYGRKNFDPVIKEWKWPDFGNVTITLARTEGLKNFDPDAEITSWDRMKVSVPSKNPKLQKTQCMLECGEWITTPRNVPERLVLKIWLYTEPLHEGIYFALCDGKTVEVEPLFRCKEALPVQGSTHVMTDEQCAKIRSAVKLVKKNLKGRFDTAFDLPVGRIESHRRPPSAPSYRPQVR
jgi:hypothetical protein